MKNLHLLAFSLAFSAISGSSASAQDRQLEKIWATDSVLKVPESVLYSATENVLYVANIDGEPWGKDGKGSIGKVETNGKIIKVDWVSGLNAAKGMGLYEGKLYVADLSEVVVIDTKKGVILEKISVDGAQGLNDLTIDTKGVIYVTDSKNKKLHKIENKKVSTVLESLQGPNGVLADESGLYILDAGGLYKIEADNKLTKITDGMEGGTDGLQYAGNGDHIVSCWAGQIFYVKADGSKQKLLDTREQNSNTADLSFDEKNKILYVPTFFRNSVVAYKLK